MSVTLTAYHGRFRGAPLVGGQDPVSPNTLTSVWASNSYYLAAQFQDGEVLKLEITLEKPLIIRCNGDSVHHAKIVQDAHEDVLAGSSDHDGVIFIDTIDGMECGDVVAVFGRQTEHGWSVDHAVRHVGTRYYDDLLDAWASRGGFAEDVDSLPQSSSWEIEEEQGANLEP